MPIWNDMTSDEKLEDLRIDLDNFIKHFNGAMERTLKRVDALEKPALSNTQNKS